MHTALLLVVGIGVASMCSTALRTVDTKRFAAISSVLHMQILVAACAWMATRSIVTGVMIQLLAHSWIASLLFYVIGDIYEQHGSRLAVSLYVTSNTGTVLLILLLANSGFPCTASYYAE